MQDIRKISPQDAASDQACVILDVRTDIEHSAAALKMPHIHLPLDKLDAADFIKAQKLDGNRPLYILCRAGGRAAKAAESFRQAGFDNVHVIDGGIMNCETCGVPVNKGEVISLERQVRIAVGSTVLLGVMLGAFANPWFYMLPAFCGAGLIMAGVTEWCGMAMLLARAPWNKAAGPAKACCNT
ncbi:MAG: rhodanese-like domain-containing protein [Alphaproteobacteria bacterium]|nr:rhodanese-like domain-containing protein [Alphaproteobacteria bacterium]